jgi:CRP/FNR family transcriptional regulator, cyclic AMP receptor protein
MPFQESPDELVDFLRRVPLFSDLDDEERAMLQGVLRRSTFMEGQVIFRQGGPADGLYVIVDGEVSVCRRLPGDDEVTICTLGPREVLGDMAFIDRQLRSASARARKPTRAYFLDSAWFNARWAQFDPAAFKMLYRIALILCARLRGTNREMMLEFPEVDRDGGERRISSSDLPPPAVDARAMGTVDRPLLRLLPIFREFTDAELVELSTRARRRDIPRGQVLFNEGDPGASCFITLRGAVEVSMHRGEKKRLAILGPGRMFGQVALIDGGGRSATCMAREHAVLLELEHEMVAQAFAAKDPIAFKLMNVVLHTLIGAQRDADAALTRLAALRQADRSD